MSDWRYIVETPFCFIPAQRAPENWDNQWVSIIRGAGITIWPRYAHDGYTFWPDPEGDRDAMAAAVHDALYQWMEEIAKAFGWKKSRFRAWADLVFYECMIVRGVKPRKAALIYRGVRVFGGVAHECFRFGRWVKSFEGNHRI